MQRGWPCHARIRRTSAGSIEAMMLRPEEWASFTRISVAPAIWAPSMAATASRVICSRNSCQSAWFFSASSQWVMPAQPSISTLM